MIDRYWHQISNSWEPEGHYCCQLCYLENQKGPSYRYRHCTVIAPFWFSMEYLLAMLLPFWLLTDDIQSTTLASHKSCFKICKFMNNEWYRVMNSQTFPCTHSPQKWFPFLTDRRKCEYPKNYIQQSWQLTHTLPVRYQRTTDNSAPSFKPPRIKFPNAASIKFSSGPRYRIMGSAELVTFLSRRGGPSSKIMRCKEISWQNPVKYTPLPPEHSWMRQGRLCKPSTNVPLVSPCLLFKQRSPASF